MHLVGNIMHDIVKELDNNLSNDIKQKIFDSYATKLKEIYNRCSKKFSKAISLAIEDFEKFQV